MIPRALVSPTTETAMATHISALLVSLLLCLTYVRSEGEDLQPLVVAAEETLQAAKTHVEHMLGLTPLPNEDKIHPIVKNETEHLAYEIKKLASQLHEKVATGEHKPELKTAVETAVVHLNEAAAALEPVGADLKEANTKYMAAADTQLQEIKRIVAATPCHLVAPVIKSALKELKHDVDNYQYGVHEAIGPHEGGQDRPGHVDGHSHHHHHHGASSEESNEDSKSNEHSHSHGH